MFRSHQFTRSAIIRHGTIPNSHLLKLKPHINPYHVTARSVSTNKRHIHRTISKSNQSTSESIEKGFDLSRSLLSRIPVECEDCLIPPLPSITDDAIYRRVFDFSSELVQPGCPPEDSLKLEWLGDSYFFKVLNDLLHSKVPNKVSNLLISKTEYIKRKNPDLKWLQQSSATHHTPNELLVIMDHYNDHLRSNIQMAKWSNAYGLAKMVYPKSKRDKVLGRNIEHKDHADIFESYIGGLYLNYKSDLSIVENYIEDLVIATVLGPEKESS